MSSTIHLLRPVLASLLLVVAAGASAKGSIEAGSEKSKVCQACHGVDGNGTGDGQYPRIAGQYADYLVHALRAYRSGERNNAIMAGFVATLSDADINDLAAFYAAQSGPLDDISKTK